MQWSSQSACTLCHPETPFVLWPCNEKRRQECYKGSNNDEDGKGETSRMAKTEVDGQNEKRFERTPAQSKARTEQRSLDKCNTVMAIDSGKG